jgi:prevent-host-death family protein
MKTIPLAEAKNQFSAVVDDVVNTHEAVSVTRNGVPVVVILAGDDYESLLETLELACDGNERALLTQAEADVAAGNVVTGDEMAALMADRLRREAGAGE